ncbi:MAG: T9SS type A sorting domain-containing protein, partial [Bacteroidota bacterium]
RAVLTPGESITVIVRFNGNNPDGPYEDLLDIWFGFAGRKIPVRAHVLTNPSGGIDLPSASVPGYALDGARPNPVSGKTTISYRLAASGPVSVSIYNAAGERVALLAEGVRSAGEGSVTWNASAQPGGIYFCRIESGQWSATRTFVVAR